jgi:hypothetical protein
LREALLAQVPSPELSAASLFALWKRPFRGKATSDFSHSDEREKQEELLDEIKLLFFDGRTPHCAAQIPRPGVKRMPNDPDDSLNKHFHRTPP